MNFLLRLFFITAGLGIGFSTHALPSLLTDPIEGQPVESKMGFNVDILGPIYGEYKLGVTTFVTSKIQVGVFGAYYDTYLFWPRIMGWQAEARVNYFFRDVGKKGLFLGASGGYESVKTRDDGNDPWELHDGLTWALVPGYAWVFGPHATLLIGVRLGESFGEYSVMPELGFGLAL